MLQQEQFKKFCRPADLDQSIPAHGASQLRENSIRRRLNDTSPIGELGAQRRATGVRGTATPSGRFVSDRPPFFYRRPFRSFSGHNRVGPNQSG
jgi:hypothetical protein